MMRVRFRSRQLRSETHRARVIASADAAIRRTPALTQIYVAGWCALTKWAKTVFKLQMYGRNLVKMGTFPQNVPILLDWISRAATTTWPTGDLKCNQNECGTNRCACLFVWKTTISVNFRAISTIGVFPIRSAS